MKNIVMVVRYADNKKRLYCLPEGVSVKAGTLVRVEYNGTTSDGVALSNSYEVDETTAEMVAVFLRIPCLTLNTLMRVVNVYEEHVVEWPADEADEQEEA